MKMRAKRYCLWTKTIFKQNNMETTTVTLPDYSKMSLSQIACCIGADWKKAKGGIYFGAKPYIDAMATLHSIKDNYIADSGSSIVAYFLGNAATWRGEVAKAVKKELNKRLKEN